MQYKIVRGAVPNKVVDTLNNRDLFQRFADAADELIAEGVDGITTTCGFLALYQQELAAHCSVPVATSALLQVPMVARMLPKGKRPGDPDVLGRSRSPMHHLAAVGIDPDTPVVGMPRDVGVPALDPRRRRLGAVRGAQERSARASPSA